MAAKPSLIVPILATALVAFGPVSTDMYLPSLPAMTRDLATDVGTVQLTLSVFIAGFAVAQLAYGPLSDRFGRKPVLLGGLALYLLATVACYLSPTIETLIVARFFQALGACSGPVLGRAMVRDLYGREGAARVLAYMSTAMGVAPAAAPIFGGWLEVAFGWRANFAAIALFGIVILALVLTLLPETHTERDHRAAHPIYMLRTYAGLIGDASYLGYVLVISFAYGALFCFISGSSFVLIDVLGVAPERFGIFFAIMVGGYMTGSFLGGRYTMRLGIDRIVLIGTSVSAATGVAMAALSWVLADAGATARLWAIVVTVVPMSVGIGLSMANAMAGAIGPYPTKAGAATALAGFTQMTMAAVMGALVGQLHDGTALPMAAMMAVNGVGGFAAYVLLVWRRRAAREETLPVSGEA